MSGIAGLYDLKDEAQAKEYLDRIGVEYRFQCYHENLPEGCHRLADFLEAFRQDWDKARLVYSKNCLENKYGPSCFKFGNYNLVGRGSSSKDATAAYDAYALGCSNKHGPCCHNAALIHQTGRAHPDGKQDYVRSAEMLERGCVLGNVPSCQLLSTYFITGKPGVEKDMKRAFVFAEKACEGGHMAACANIARMYRLGEGVETNSELANKFLQKAKDLHRKNTETERPLTFGE